MVEERALGFLRITGNSLDQPLQTLILILTVHEIGGHKIRIYDFILMIK